MRPLALAVVALMAATPALAQTSAPPSPTSDGIDPVKLQLARELVELQGGRARVEQQMKAMYAAMNMTLQTSLPPEVKSSAQHMQTMIQSRVVAMIPALMDISTRNFAEGLTEQELRDDVAFQNSASGRAISQKLPAITLKTVSETLPLLTVEMPKIMNSLVDDLCAEQHCTPELRQQVAAAMSKAFPGQSHSPG